MRSLSLCICIALIGVSLPALAQEPGLDHTMYRMAPPGGFAVTPDLVQLIVSQPDSAELVFFDTLTEKETDRVEMEFQPNAMVLRDDSLFVTAKGASIVYEISLKTKKVKKEFSIAADGISRIAAHPKKPLLFVSTLKFEVYGIDTSTGKSFKTTAMGDHLAVSPDGQSLYTGMQPRSSNGVLLIDETPDGKIRFLFDRWGIRATLAKYKINGNKLSVASSQANASVNGWMMHLSPDGKRLMITGGGGWRPPAEAGAGGGYVTAIFNADNLSAKLGQGPHAEAIVYHPVLDLGAAAGAGHNLVLFNGKSFKERETIMFSQGGGGGREVLAFVGKGTKVALYNGANPATNNEGLHFFEIDLTKDERAKLVKEYGELPPRVESVAGAAPTKGNPEEKPDSKPNPGDPNPAATSKDSGSGKKSSEALAGFNDAQGINANEKKSSPYALGGPNFQPGAGEPGWESPWAVNEKVKYQREVVQEGDGALFLGNESGTNRKLAVPHRGRVRFEQFVQIPENGDLKVYCNQGEGNTAAMWLASSGRFFVIDGNGIQESPPMAIDTQIECTPGQWFKVTIDLDFNARSWTFAVDDNKFDHAPLHFRGQPEFFQQIGLLSEKPGGAYIDAITVGVSKTGDVVAVKEEVKPTSEKTTSEKTVSEKTVSQKPKSGKPATEKTTSENASTEKSLAVKSTSEKEPPRVDLLRFYDTKLNEHVYTYGDGEPANWRNRKELNGETVVGRVALTKEPGTVPLFRGVRADGRHYFYLKKSRDMKDFKLEEFHVYVWTNGSDGRVPIHACVLPDLVDLYLDRSQKNVNDFTAGTLKGTGMKRKVTPKLFFIYPPQADDKSADSEKTDEDR